jgi:hypothetical protein
MDTNTISIPPPQAFVHASKLAITDDKPIMLDYWVSSLDENSNVIIGVKESGEKLLVKSEDEYTSTVCKIYKVDTCYICVTENSIYLVSSSIKSKKIT